MDEWARWVIQGLIGLVLAVFAWMFKRFAVQLDEKADKDTTERRFEEVLARFDKHMDEDRALHQEMGRKLDRTNEHLSTTNTTLAALAGRFDERSRNGHA